MNKKISLGLAISLIAIVATIAIAATYTVAINSFEERMSAITDRQTTYDIITEIDGKIRQKYAGEVSEENLRDAIGAGFIDGLENPDCTYFTAEQWDLESDRAAGYDFGLGLSVSKASDGNVQIKRVMPGSPAAKAGIKKGDVITYVDGVTVLSTGYDKAVSTINSSNAEVTLKIRRDGNETSYNITKAKFDIVSVEYYSVKGVGYISINRFNDRTPDQFNSALNKLQQGGTSGLIIDLRDSTGGSYEKACDILDTLLPAGKLMLFTDKSGETSVLYSSDKQAVNLPMCVLINGGTTGASEFFASAMFDYGKAELVGTATKGQMQVQESFTLSNGAAIRLTTGKWSTTSGLAVQNGVVVPGFEVKLTGYQEENLYMLKPDDDPQIQTALERIASAIEAQKEAEAAAQAALTGSASPSDAPTSATAATTTTAPTTAATTAASTAAQGN